MKLNLKRLKKDEILWLASHKCRHKHYYIEHQNCFIEENPKESPLFEKIGFLDIESGGSLTADFGYTFSYCIKEMDGELIFNIITPKEIKEHTFDKRLLSELVEDLLRFDRIVVYWGKDRRHDIPFIRTRAIKNNIEFPGYKSINIVDVYDIVRGKLRLYRNRMENACELFGISSKKHPLNPEVWQKALAGNKRALNYILIHNKEDAISLEQLFKKVCPFVRLSKTSI